MTASRLPRLAPLAAALTLLLSTAPAYAGLKLDGKAKVSFYAEGSPGALDIEGKTSEMQLTDDGTTVSCAVPLANVSTGIDMRDSHMKEKFLEVEKYPEAQLSFPRAQLQLPTDASPTTQGSVQATFKVHGVEQPVTVTYTIKKGKSAYTVDASFEYNASSHGIAIPSYLGITVAPEQKARVRFDMIDE